MGTVNKWAGVFLPAYRGNRTADATAIAAVSIGAHHEKWPQRVRGIATRSSGAAFGSNARASQYRMHCLVPSSRTTLCKPRQLAPGSGVQRRARGTRGTGTRPISSQGAATELAARAGRCGPGEAAPRRMRCIARTVRQVSECRRSPHAISMSLWRETRRASRCRGQRRGRRRRPHRSRATIRASPRRRSLRARVRLQSFRTCLSQATCRSAGATCSHHAALGTLSRRIRSIEGLHV
jgi:hypothetical protein